MKLDSSKYLVSHLFRYAKEDWMLGIPLCLGVSEQGQFASIIGQPILLFDKLILSFDTLTGVRRLRTLPAYLQTG